ncbi:MAG: hypothetical protein H0U87_01350 [Acidobacteria bacterium]|jgi:hypothetical protein|nr:hypothetical protein [Acidobacteriota bacterium]
MKLIERLAAPLLFLLLAAFCLFQSVRKPEYNWDMIAYIACANSFEQHNAESLHWSAFQETRNAVPAAKYAELVDETGDSYRHSVSSNAAAFGEQLPNYRTRLIYTSLIYLLNKAGANIVFATHLISGLAVGAAIGLLYFMSAAFLAKPLIYAVPPLALIFEVRQVTVLSTPDGLAFLAIIASIYLYLKSRVTLLLIVLPIIIGVRTDLILFTIPLLFFIFLFDNKNRWKAALSAIISIAVYIGLGAYFGYVGWSVIFYHSFIELSAHQISAPPTLTASQYFNILFRGSIIMFFNKAFSVYALLTVYSFYLIRSRVMKTSAALKSFPAVLTYVCFIYVAVHFALFPSDWERYFTASYMVGSFAFLMLINDRLNESLISD